MYSPHIEIELRFLVRSDEWKKSNNVLDIEQRYISLHPSRSVRIRLSGDQGFLTVKGLRQNNANAEYEWSISAEQVREMYKNSQLFEGYPIVKRRYALAENRFTWKGSHLEWHIDEFLEENFPLCIAEIELVKINSESERKALSKLILETLPNWVGYQINTDLYPEDNRYNNVQLARRPVKHWQSDEKKKLMDHLGRS